ncbi:MAG: ABC transporter substrate-binding protein [Glaciimonas sp.]|nr:ABC transporter substrate-binding protein [Glaciimonas sp.]
MKILNKFIVAIFALVMLVFAVTSQAAEEAPDALVKRISQEVLDIAKADRQIQGGNQKRVLELVEQKILPYVDFQRMTSLAAGRYWREATPEQQKQLTAEFRNLLIYTYSGAIAQVKDQKLDFKPFRAAATDTEVQVRSQVLQSRGEPIQLNYRLQKSAAGWKIYDINVLGAWLVQTYKGSFSAEISKSGIDGLIKVLSDKNKRLAEDVAKTAKSS